MTTGYLTGGPSHLPGPGDRPEWKACRMPDYPEYPDLQPAVYYDRFYKEELVVRAVDGRAEIVGDPPRRTVITLEALRSSDPGVLELDERFGVLRICGKFTYQVVGYHTKHATLLLERIA